MLASPMMEAKMEKKRAEMKRAVRYRSGPDLINTVYLGGMATARMISILSNGRHQYGGKASLQECIDQADYKHLQQAWDYDGFQWILKAYREAGSKLHSFEVVATEIE